MIKSIIKIFLTVTVILIISDCKKTTPYYEIPYKMKEFFIFQQGSYWIYANDSTNAPDSTYVKSFVDIKNDLYSDVNREKISIYFKSSFLTDFQMAYAQCAESILFEVGSKLASLTDTSIYETGGAYAYCSGWPTNTYMTPTNNNCLHSEIFIYKEFPKMTIDSFAFNDVIYSYFISQDSSLSNPVFYKRGIYFAKNIGIIKYFESSRYYNINRSYTLLRYKVIQ